jgi:hypothetical protein
MWNSNADDADVADFRGFFCFVGSRMRGFNGFINRYVGYADGRNLRGRIGADFFV